MKFLLIPILVIFTTRVFAFSVVDQETPRILVSAHEYAQIPTPGGMLQNSGSETGLIVRDLITEYGTYWRRKTEERGEMFFALPAGEEPVGSEFTVLKIQMGNKIERVRVQRLDQKKQSLFLLAHPAFALLPQETQLGKLAQYTERPEWDKAYAISLFGHAVACLAEKLEISVFHGIDLAAFSAYLLDEEIIATTTITDLAPAKMGIFKGEAEALERLVSQIGILSEDFKKYFSLKNDLCLMRAVQYAASRQIISAIILGAAHDKEGVADIFSPQVFVDLEVKIASGHSPFENPFLTKERDIPLSVLNSFSDAEKVEIKKIWDKIPGFPLKGEYDENFDISSERYYLKRLASLLYKTPEPLRPRFLALASNQALTTLQELSELAQSIASFGGETVLILPEPTEDSVFKNVPNLTIVSGSRDEFKQSILFASSDFFLVPTHPTMHPLNLPLANQLGLLPVGPQKIIGVKPFSYDYKLDAPLGNLIVFKSKLIDAITIFQNDPDMIAKQRMIAMQSPASLKETLDAYVQVYDAIILKKLLDTYDLKGWDDVSIAEARLKLLSQAAKSNPQIIELLKDALKQKVSIGQEVAAWEKQLSVRTKPF